MESSVLRLLQPKAFGMTHYLIVILWTGICGSFIGTLGKIDDNESNDFKCNATKLENIDLVRTQCYDEYAKQYNKLAVPVSAFVFAYFFLGVSVCFVYYGLVARTVNRLSRSIRNGDHERDQENALSTGYKLFHAYFGQLWIRLIFGVIFIFLQTLLFYPSNFSSKFHCNQPRNSSDNAQHSTLPECQNPHARNKNFYMKGFLVVNIFFVIVILLEIIYLWRRAYIERDFRQNSKFLTSHLYTPKESEQGEERIELVTDEQNRTEQETNIRQEFIQNTKKMIQDNTRQPSQLQSLFPSPLGKGHPQKHLTLDQIYTNFVFVPDTADYEFTEDRQKNLQIYTRSGEKNETLRGPEDILNHEDKKILIVGRPGIGKTLSCTKILRDWASNKIFHETPNNKIHFDFVFFVEFRKLKATTDLCLRELLTLSTYLPANKLDDVVWNFILINPQRVLLIFDGIDEFTLNSEISTGHIYEFPFRNMVYEKMPLFSLYVKLATGKLLYGAAVMTTTRPTALSCIESITFDKTFEILGFSSEQVKEYVTKFAEEDKEAGNTVRQHITSNNNILSLCYIPASCFIICSSLFKMVKFYTPRGLNLPTSLTGIYKRAVKIFYLRHNEEFRDEPFTRKDFESDELPPEEEKKLEKLEKLAFEGIKEGRLIFGANEVRGMEDSALFHRLPDREVDSFSSEGQFCFIHLTMQEFFAAKHLTNNMSETELRNFVQMNIKEGKWQLVFQFVAGLMENKKTLPSEIITDLLPVKTEEKEHELYNVQWTENEEKTKVTCWPTKDEQYLAVTLMKCLNENSRMKSEAQRKLQQINFNCVNFIFCDLTAVDCSSLVNVINVQQISHLDLSYNNIGPLGCFEICKLLKCRESQLSWLNLTRNQLTDEAAKYLAEAINNNNCQLRTLSLRANNISDIGAQHLAKAINNNNCQLHMLNLTYNDISHIGAQHLAEAINNCQPHTLNLTK